MRREVLRRIGRSQDGFTLVELLVASSLMIVILGATLTTFEGFFKRTTLSRKQTEAQDTARRATQLIARQLRNLANPVAASPQAIDRFTATELVFKTSEPSRRRVRYCLDAGGVNADGIWEQHLWEQRQSVAVGTAADTTAPTPGPCPTDPPNPIVDTQWATKKIVVSNVVNDINGSRPLFTYDQPLSANPSTIRQIGMNLWVDVNRDTKRPQELGVATGVFLRNQNQAPTALFTWTPGSGGHQVNLNGSDSSDPEGRTLTYRWYQGPYSVADGGTCPAAPGDALLGKGVTIVATFPDNNPHDVTLEIEDPGGLCSAVTHSVTPP